MFKKIIKLLNNAEIWFFFDVILFSFFIGIISNIIYQYHILSYHGIIFAFYLRLVPSLYQFLRSNKKLEKNKKKNIYFLISIYFTLLLTFIFLNDFQSLFNKVFFLFILLFVSILLSNYLFKIVKNFEFVKYLISYFFRFFFYFSGIFFDPGKIFINFKYIFYLNPYYIYFNILNIQ